MEQKYKYELSVTIAYPSSTAPRSFKEIKTEESLKSALDQFNIKFGGKKQLIIKTLDDKKILLELSADVDLSNPTREISAFSQILCKNPDWKLYSQKANRLFEIKLLNSFDINSNKNIKSENSDFFISLGETILNSNDTNQLEKYIEQLERLTKMAKSKKELIAISGSI